MRQTEMAQAALSSRHAQRRFEVRAIATRADQRPTASLAAMGGEGIFVKELEAALLNHEIDCAVHSLKDLPLALPAGLTIAAVPARADARDAFISRAGESLATLPAQSRIGTSSLRRQSQLLKFRQDLQMAEIRGNVDTRLRKLDEGRYDAIVVASAGLIRLGLAERITEYLGFDVMLPEPGQGALAIEARTDDIELLTLLSTLEDSTTRACVEAERALLGALGGGCHVPIAAYAKLEGKELRLEAAVVSPDGREQARGVMSGSVAQPAALGKALAKELERQGAHRLLEKTERP
ncbi:MAG: hydroxymethylbilane synthase [Candidatus Omnitrophica bacterium]|nr:hydroxymethylbilane synthase [Candidatus Omnitrophota bacterium]